jgi:hypothetical protein
MSATRISELKIRPSLDALLRRLKEAEGIKDAATPLRVPEEGSTVTLSGFGLELTVTQDEIVDANSILPGEMVGKTFQKLPGAFAGPLYFYSDRALTTMVIGIISDDTLKERLQSTNNPIGLLTSYAAMHRHRQVIFEGYPPIPIPCNNGTSNLDDGRQAMSIPSAPAPISIGGYSTHPLVIEKNIDLYRKAARDAGYDVQDTLQPVYRKLRATYWKMLQTTLRDDQQRIGVGHLRLILRYAQGADKYNRLCHSGKRRLRNRFSVIEDALSRLQSVRKMDEYHYLFANEINEIRESLVKLRSYRSNAVD